MSECYDLIRPQVQTLPVVFASPHSGREYFPHFVEQSALDLPYLRSSEDAFVDHIFDFASKLGAPFLCARVPRSYVDLNRSRHELDPAIVDGPIRTVHNSRVASGLGVIPRVVAQGRNIIKGKISAEEAEARLAAYWDPYHACLQNLLNETREKFGIAILIDCHSMPRDALLQTTRAEGQIPQIVLGDRFGASANLEIVDSLHGCLQGQGFRVARNAPFSGVYIAQNYGRPSLNQHVVQIEIDRSLYMDEETLKVHDGMDDLRTNLYAAIKQFTGLQFVWQKAVAE